MAEAKPRTRKPRAVADAGVPPLEAVDQPPPRKPARRTTKPRRGATAPPGPADLVAQRERERKAIEAAQSGINDWDKIAEISGYNDRSAAWKAVQRALNRQEFAAVADYRRLMLSRYERLVEANWDAANQLEESVAKDKATARLFKAFEGIRRTAGLDLEIERLVDAFRIPESEAERFQELQQLREGLRVVGGTSVE